jgi:Spy/CpxP family protein refolding chaperone
MMPNSPEQSSTSLGGSKLKIVLSMIVLIGVGWYGWGAISPYFRGMEPEPEAGATVTSTQRDGERRGRRDRSPPSPEERRAWMEQMAQELNLTEDQQEKLKAIREQPRPESREDWRQRREQMQAVMTEEQRQQARQMVRGRMNQRLERMREQLSPEDFETLRKRREERFNNYSGGGGRGGRRIRDQ